MAPREVVAADVLSNQSNTVQYVTVLLLFMVHSGVYCVYLIVLYLPYILRVRVSFLSPPEYPCNISIQCQFNISVVISVNTVNPFLSLYHYPGICLPY